MECRQNNDVLQYYSLQRILCLFCLLCILIITSGFTFTATTSNKSNRRLTTNNHDVGSHHLPNNIMKQQNPLLHHHSYRRRRTSSLRRAKMSSMLQATPTFEGDQKTMQPTNTIVSEFKQIRFRIVNLLKENDYEAAKQLVMGMFEYLQEEADSTSLASNSRLEVCESIDGTLDVFYRSVFALKGKGLAKRRVIGMEILNMQLSSSPGSVLDSPYNTVPKQTLLNALKALTRVKEVRQARMRIGDGSEDCAEDDAYRLLQRLVTGVGIRQQQQQQEATATTTNKKNSARKMKMRLYESDFNMVLNAYSNVGRMGMAHRVVALQERTDHAPPLTAITYSILLKGYGRLKDLNNVEMLLSHAKASNVEPDLIMVNSILDAFINCGEWLKAKEIFDCIRTTTTTTTAAGAAGDDDNSNKHNIYKDLFYVPPEDNVDDDVVVIPNKRTYNIIMKGYAAKGLLIESLELASEMERLELWDHVTTNTLVQAAVNAKEFDVVEQILERHTTTTTTEKNNTNKKRHHPNAEAYTSAIDGYAKAGELQNALDLLKTMNKRGVPPNEFTYTCLVGALARKKLIPQANKMIDFMKSSGLKVGVITYNSFISGLVDNNRNTGVVSVSGNNDDGGVGVGYLVDDGDGYDRHVDAAINVLRTMMKDGIKPTPVTISILVDAFGRCNIPRLAEAKSLVDKLESDGVIRKDHIRVMTALIQVYGASGNLEGAVNTFGKISNPDIAAVNAFLNACCQCEADNVANDTFEKHFRDGRPDGIGRRPITLRPDVISYSIMISMELQKRYKEASKRARNLYEEMKFQRRLTPDKALVDIILKGMIENGKCGGLTAGDVRFIASVLRDAEKLDWREGQLDSRRGAIQTVMTGRIADTWEEEAILFGLLSSPNDSPSDSEDEMFKRHGWNKVDSGFQLWGAKIGAESQPERRGSQRDDFLESKGWNDVDSGFRII